MTPSLSDFTPNICNSLGPSSTDPGDEEGYGGEQGADTVGYVPLRSRRTLIFPRLQLSRSRTGPTRPGPGRATTGDLYLREDRRSARSTGIGTVVTAPRLLLPPGVRRHVRGRDKGRYVDINEPSVPRVVYSPLTRTLAPDVRSGIRPTGSLRQSSLLSDSGRTLYDYSFRPFVQVCSVECLL